MIFRWRVNKISQIQPKKGKGTAKINNIQLIQPIIKCYLMWKPKKKLQIRMIMISFTYHNIGIHIIHKRMIIIIFLVANSISQILIIYRNNSGVSTTTSILNNLIKRKWITEIIEQFKETKLENNNYKLN